MKNGFIFLAFTALVTLCKKVNLVEYAKLFSAFALSRYTPYSDEIDNIIARKNIGIDVFQLFKWGFVLTLIMTGQESPILKYMVAYLIWSNLFTYFYYHAWGSSFGQRSDVDTQRRRFLNFLLSIMFYVICYAYLYQFHFVADIQWPDRQVDIVNAIYLSVANAFTLTYGGFSPMNQTARVIFMTELINTFFFLTVIVANSIPSITDRK